MTSQICKAPVVSMYFEVNGSVLACCHNRLHPLGSILDDDIESIWHGRPAQELRRHLAVDDLSHGCEACAFEIDGGNRAGATAATFDRFEPDAWPRRMEFALSNRCNLACVMCNGEYSSRIRAEREHLPAVTTRYGDAFFEQLKPFLPHLEQARFFGGEPFLVPEYQRIWDLMIHEGVAPECNVTTNGTIRTPRTEAALASLPFSIGVSVDGMTKATVESIRVGADYDTVMANVAWFRDYCADRGTSFGLTYCLMTENWHEFGDFLAFADSIDTSVAVNRVMQPVRFSLLHLGLADYDQVLDGLRAADDRMSSQLTRNAGVWRAQLALLTSHRATLIDGTSAADLGQADHLLDIAFRDVPPVSAQAVAGALEAVALGPVDALYTNASDEVTGTKTDAFLGMEPQNVIGRPAQVVLPGLTAVLGSEVRVLADRSVPGAVARVFAFTDGRRTRWIVSVTTAAGPADDHDGQTYVAAIVADLREPDQPVALRTS